MKKKFDELFDKPWAAYTVAACTAVVLYLVLNHLYFLNTVIRYINPILWGILIAYLINPIVIYGEKRIFHKMKNEFVRHVVSVICALVFVLLIMGLLLATLIPSIVSSVRGIVNNIEDYGTVLSGYMELASNWGARFNIDFSNLTAAVEKSIQNIVDYVTSNADTVANAFFSVGSNLVNIGIGIVIAVYFLFDKKNIVNSINKLRRLLLKEKTFDQHNSFLNRCNKILSRFLMFDVIDGIIIALINALLMFIFRMPNIALISVVIGVTNLLPTFGPIIGCIVGGIILVLTNPWQALIFIIFTIIIQTFDASILKPKMFGDSFGVPAVWIFIAIIMGGKIFGVLGILFAVPVAAIFTYILTEIIIPYLENRKK